MHDSKVTQPTPGPWSIRGLSVYGAGVNVAQLPARLTTALSTTEIEVAEANARLIAAAPELLQACKELREALCAAMRVIAEIDTGTLLDKVIPGIRSETANQRFVDEVHSIGLTDGFGVRVQNVIAKATGGAQ